MKRTRTHYDTTVAYLFMTGNEDLLPLGFCNSIPASTRATFRSYVPEKFFGFEQRKLLDEGIRRARLDIRYKHLRKVLLAVETIYMALSGILSMVKIPLYRVKQNREMVLNCIQQYKTLIGLDKLLDVFQLSRSTYQTWLLNIKVKCSASFFEQCVRRYGTQLLKQQVELIREALTSEIYKHWPVASIAYHFQRKGWLHASVTTWYKYRKLLGIIRQWYRKKERKPPMPCTRINEYWHVDITHFTTLDDVKHFVYFLSDNFSRKILAWRVGLSVDWNLVKECIADAYRYAIGIENPLSLSIVADGGPENTNKKLDEFIASLKGNIKKTIALKDITFSNSPAEAHNKTFKKYYASEKDTQNMKQLIDKISFFVNDFNGERPAAALKGFTPDEVYLDKKPVINFEELRKQDALLRKQTNKNTACNACEFVKG